MAVDSVGAMTTPRADDVFLRGLDTFDQMMDRLPDGVWDRPSACAGWTNLDVLGHLGSSMSMGLALMAGEQPQWPTFDRPADLVEGSPADYWAGLSSQLRRSMEGIDLDLVMDTPMGPRTVADRLAFPAVDLFVHAWDIGHPSGLEVEVPDDVIEFTHGHIDPIPVEMVRGENGAFGPEVPAPDDATATEAFMAWTGRNPR